MWQFKGWGGGLWLIEFDEEPQGTHSCLGGTTSGIRSSVLEPWEDSEKVSLGRSLFHIGSRNLSQWPGHTLVLYNLPYRKASSLSFRNHRSRWGYRAGLFQNTWPPGKPGVDPGWGVGLQSPAAVQCHGGYRKVSSAYSYSSHGLDFLFSNHLSGSSWRMRQEKACQVVWPSSG